MLTIFAWLNIILSCFKQLPLNFGYALLKFGYLYVNSAGARLLSGDLMALFNTLDFHSVIESLGESTIGAVFLNVLKYLCAG